MDITRPLVKDSEVDSTYSLADHHNHKVVWLLSWDTEAVALLNAYASDPCTSASKVM